jgi:hypothetical protein
LKCRWPQKNLNCVKPFLSLKLRKTLLLEGDVCSYNAFSKKDFTLLLYYWWKGNEHTMQFAFEGWWISDLSSFYWKCVYLHYRGFEDSELLLLLTLQEKTWWINCLFLSVTKEYYCRMLLLLCKELMAQMLRQRRNIRIWPCPILILLHVYPAYVASYLGLTPET